MVALNLCAMDFERAFLYANKSSSARDVPCMLASVYATKCRPACHGVSSDCFNNNYLRHITILLQDSPSQRRLSLYRVDYRYVKVGG